MTRESAIACVLGIGFGGAAALAGWPSYFPFASSGAWLVSDDPASHLMAAYNERRAVVTNVSGASYDIFQSCPVFCGIETTDVIQLYSVQLTNGVTNLMWYGTAEWSTNPTPQDYANTVLWSNQVLSCSEVVTGRVMIVRDLVATVLSTNLVGWFSTSNVVTYAGHPRGLFATATTWSATCTTGGALNAYQPLTYSGAAQLDAGIMRMATNAFVDDASATGGLLNAWFGGPTYQTNWGWTGGVWVVAGYATNYPSDFPYWTASSLLSRAAAGTTVVSDVTQYDYDQILLGWQVGQLSTYSVTNSFYTNTEYKTRWSIAPNATNLWELARIPALQTNSASPPEMSAALAAELWFSGWQKPSIVWKSGSTSTEFSAFSVGLAGEAWVDSPTTSSVAAQVTLHGFASTQETVSVSSQEGAACALSWRRIDRMWMASGVTTNSTNEQVSLVYRGKHPVYYPSGAWSPGRSYCDARYAALNLLAISKWSVWYTNMNVISRGVTSFYGYPTAYPDLVGIVTNQDEPFWMASKGGNCSRTITTYTWGDGSPTLYATDSFAQAESYAGAAKVRLFVGPAHPSLTNVTGSADVYLRYSADSPWSTLGYGALGTNSQEYISGADDDANVWLYSTSIWVRGISALPGVSWQSLLYEKSIAVGIGTTNSSDYTTLPTSASGSFDLLSGDTDGYETGPITFSYYVDPPGSGNMQSFSHEAYWRDFQGSFLYTLEDILGVVRWTFDYR